MYQVTYRYIPHDEIKYHTFEDIHKAIKMYIHCVKSKFKSEVTANFDVEIFDRY